MAIHILSLSDRVDPYIYSTRLRERLPDIDLVIGCGDLPYSYVEFAVSSLDAPGFFVRGNHAAKVEEGPGGPQRAPLGAVDLHRRVVRHRGLLLAGVEGCLRYRPAAHQYSQGEMWGHVLRLVPGMLYNRLRWGRFLDVFVTHAPAWGIGDLPDRPHQGLQAFRWLIEKFQPRLHLHGHVHAYHVGALLETRLGDTRIINTCGYRRVELEAPGLDWGQGKRHPERARPTA